MLSVDQKDSKEVKEKNIAIVKTDGWSRLYNDLCYNFWYFSKVFTANNLLYLLMLQAWMRPTEDNSESWTTNVTMKRLAASLGISRNSLTEPLKVLSEKPLECPICEKQIRIGLIEKKKKQSGNYSINISPYLEVIGHLQNHYKEDPELYFSKKQKFLEGHINISYVESMKKNKAVRKVKEGKIVYFAGRPAKKG